MRMPSPRRPKILFPILEYGEFRELFRVAKAYAEHRPSEVVFYFIKSTYRNLEVDTRMICDAGFRWLDSFGVLKDSPAPPGSPLISNAVSQRSGKPTLIPALPPLEDRQGDRAPSLDRSDSALATFIARTILPFRLAIYLATHLLFRRKDFLRVTKREFQLFLGYRKVVATRENIIRMAFESFRPDVLIVGQDFAGSEITILLHAAKALGVLRLMIPFALTNTRTLCEVLYGRNDLEPNQGPLNFIASHLFPEWVNNCKGKRLLRVEGAKILALKLAGYSPIHPWVSNLGDVDEWLLDSNYTLRQYVENGFPKKNLQVCGSLVMDRIANAKRDRKNLRQALRVETGIDENTPLIVCSWPSNQLLETRPNPEFKTYSDLCHFWTKELLRWSKSSGWAVVVRMHPKSSAADRKLVSETGLTVSDWDTADLIPIGDLFVASMSSTISWAIAAGLPVINYDVNRYGYLDYETAKGVLTMSDGESFSDTLKNLTHNPDAFRKAVAEARACATEYGLIDGAAGVRTAAAIDAALGSRW